jgi:sugar lactone lactonase YvrE
VGNLYVSDFYNKRILQYAPGNTIGKNIIRDNSYIFDIILPDSIEVYLSNAQGNILSYTPRFVGSDGSWQTYTTHVVYLQAPKAIALYAAKNLYIVELYGSSVLKFAPGSQVRTVVAGGNGDGNAANQLNQPEGITIDSAGNLYIADTRNHRVQKWAPGATSGVTVAGGKFGQGPDCLAWPQDVKLDKAGNIYIADVGNNRVQKWPKM